MPESQGDRSPEFGPVYQQLRKDLMKRLGDVDGQVLISVVSLRPGEPARELPHRLRTDWPDSYNRDTWYKTWAKSDSMSVLPPEADGGRAAD